MEKLSVIIIVKEEEKNIAECISTVNWADEIIVIDGESSDETVEIAKKFTDKVFIRRWEGYVIQKKYAINLVTNNWILSIDADERVTPELAEEIKKLDCSNIDGFKIKRKNFIFSREIKSCGWENDFQLRLFKKEKVDLTNRQVHEAFIVDGKVEKLTNPMVHHTFSSFTDYFSKINNYSSLKAKELYEQGKKSNGLIIFSRTAIAFFTFFIIRRGFTDGIYGLIISLFHSISTMMNYMKLWELQIKKRI